ncbi:MAG: VWA domain-containing protein, partial [Limisphaerales bacterium]
MKTETFLDYDTILADHTQPVHFAIRFQAEALTPSQSRLHPAAFCVVLDRSGSMAGAPLDHAKAAAALAVRHLRAEDHFALVVFDDQARTVIPLQPATVRR